MFLTLPPHRSMVAADAAICWRGGWRQVRDKFVDVVDLDSGLLRQFTRWRSGCAVVTRCSAAAAGLVAAQGEDAGGGGDVPAHAGQFEALGDDGFAAGLDGAGSHFDRYLGVCDGSVLKVATNRFHFEPVESACGLRRSCQTVADRRVDSVGCAPIISITR
jgi:hypothetical protein